ncbi:MAG TPA: TonB-dependent receptor [Verrucomicrobiae bacterium]|nr:TonB-dependent receptor [Verrucomicrobiae bacterium]
MKPTVVTGSYIPTAETVTATPVQTLTTEAITEAGEADTLITLRQLVPGFTGSGNYLGSVNNNVNIGAGFQAFTGESYASIRNLTTLILIDGQRVVSSALSGAQAVDLNSIPIAMIERIEVLKDGASAIYGSDAIGGVINIITKKNYNGFELSGRYGFPTDGPGTDGVQYQVSLVAGVSTENARFTAGAQIYEQNPVQTKDRSIGALSADQLAAANVGVAPSYFSPSFPGKVQVGSTIYVLASSPFANPSDPHYVGAGGVQAGYNPSLTTPPVFPGQTFVGPNSIANYNAYAIAHGYVAPGFTSENTPGPYLSAPGVGAVLNTTEFGSTTILSQDRKQFWANAERDLIGDHLTVYSHLLYSDNSAEGQLAPSPVPSLTTYNTTIPANNPYNPFGVVLGQGQGTGTNAPPRVRSRFVDFGNRDFVSLSDFFQWVGGLKGKITPDYGYDMSFDYGQDRQEQQTRNAVNGALLNQALTPIGPVDAQGRPLSALLDASGNNLPVYNFLGGSLTPGAAGNAQSTIDALKSTLFYWGQSELWSAQGVFNATPFELPAGKLGIAAGGQYINENLRVLVDGLSQGNLAPGLNVAVPFPAASRKTAAGFIEASIPITGPDMNIPGFYDFSLDVAGRYQTFDPGGDAAVPKISVRWQPLDDEITLRGSYNQGFIAPSIYNLYGPAFASQPNVIIPAHNGLPASIGQVQTEVVGNPNLKASNSEQYGAGIVITPKKLVDGLTLSLDYYRVTQDHLPVADYQSVANSLAALGPASPYASGFTTQDGLPFTSASQVTVDNWLNATFPWQPNGALRTDGFDIGATYVIPDAVTHSFGKITLGGVADYKLSYQVQQSPSLPFIEYKGTFTPFQGTIPEWDLNLSLTWEFKGFTYTVMANYVPEISDPGLLIGPYSQPQQGFTINNPTQPYKVPDYYTINMRLSYEFGKDKTEGRKWYDGTRLTVGCLNIADAQPLIIPDAVEDNTDKNVYDILGRFVYFEVSKKF